MQELGKKVSDFIRTHRLLLPGERVLLAVSGGLDSSVLLHIFNQFRQDWGIEIGVVHFNHRLRGTESERDLEFVRQTAEILHLHFHSGQWPWESEKCSESLQVRARKARFEFFNRIMAEFGYHKIALAHQQDDHLETVLMGLLKGYGFPALSGIQPISGKRIHPFLNLTREEIEAYARKNHLKWVEDSSNKEDKYLRNRIRHRVLPFLKKTVTEFEPALLRLSLEAGILKEWIEGEIKQFWDEGLIKDENSTVIIEIDKFLQYIIVLQKHILLSAFSRLCPEYRPSPSALSEIERMLNSPVGTIKRMGPVEVLKDRGNLIFRIASPAEFEISIFPGESYIVNHYRFETDIIDPSGVVFNRNPEIEFMDYKAIRGGLRLRNWRAGDRFFPFGSKKAMKISDFLVNNKISVFDKEKIVLLCDEQKVLWICGMRLDDRAKITDDTVQVLKMTFSKSG